MNVEEKHRRKGEIRLCRGCHICHQRGTYRSELFSGQFNLPNPLAGQPYYNSPKHMRCQTLKPGTNFQFQF